MKMTFQRLPIALQSIFIGTLWLIFASGLMLFQIPNAASNNGVSFSPIVPYLSQVNGVLTADWLQFTFWFTLFLTWYAVYRFVRQTSQDRPFKQLVQMVMPIWSFTIGIIFLLTFWIPVAGLNELRLAERSVLTIVLLVFIVFFVGTFRLYGEILRKSSQPHKVIKILIWFSMIVIMFILMWRMNFAIHGQTILKNAFLFGGVEYPRITVSFWPSWVIGMVITAGWWLPIKKASTRLKNREEAM